jgi:branched-subunit amino acid ABC-type transport system permease component
VGLIIGTLVFGLAQGGAIALLGAGIVAIHRGSRVVNLAHGAFGMFATYVFATVLGGNAQHPSPLSVAVAFALGCACGAGLGLLTDWAVMRRLASRPATVRMTATLGMLYVLLSLAQLLFGAGTRSVPSVFGAGNHRIGLVVLTNDVLGIAVLALLLSVLLGMFYQRTRIGTTIRAVADSRQTAALGGIRVDRVGSLSWGIGGATAALAGIVLAPSTGLNSYILTLLVVQALAAALTGRLQHLLPTLVGGVAIGVITAFAREYLDQLTSASPPAWVNVSAIQDGIALLWMIGAVAAWRQSGRARGVRAGMAAAGELLRAPVDGPVRIGLVLMALAAAAIVPLALGASGLYLLSIGVAYAAAILSLVVVTGMSGQFSLAQAGFMGVGAFAAAHLAAIASLPLVVTVPLGGLAAVPIGVLAGLITLRAGGVLTAVVTLGLGAALSSLFFTAGFNGGATGSMALQRGGALSSPLVYCWFEIGVLALLIAFVCALRTRRAGRRMAAVRDSEHAAAALGISPARTRLAAFALSAFIAGVAGVLYSGVDQIASSRTFGPFASIGLLAAGVVGGLGSTAGAVIGGLLQALGPGGLSSLPLINRLGDPGDVGGVLLGILLLVQVSLAPAGLSRPLLRAEAGVARRLRTAVRRTPARGST